MASITEVSNWLISLKILWFNMWARIYPTGQIWSTCSPVYPVIWWNCRKYIYTAILRGRKRRYSELTLFAYFYFTGYASNRSIFNRSGWKSAHRCTTNLNSGTSSSQYIYGDTSGYSWLHQYPGSGFVDDKYDSQESVLYWRFTYIKEWCQLKANIPARRGGVYYGYRKINCLQSLAWWQIWHWGVKLSI